MDKSEPIRKRIRLETNVYAQPGMMCSITIAVQHRRRIFDTPSVASAAVDVLVRHANTTGVPIYAFCIMPDHVHLVLAPSDNRDITAFVGQFKSLVQREVWRLGISGTFWQRSYWDHFLRAEEDLNTVVAYVLGNPVRAGMVDDWRDYPYSGSLVFDL